MMNYDIISKFLGAFMKRKLICLMISLFLISNTFAQSVAVDGVGILTEKPANPGALSRTLGWGVKKIFTTPIKISGRAIGACLLSKKICAGIAAGTLSFAYLYDHPEAVEHFLEKHPEQYDALQKYFNYRKSQTQDASEIAKYDQAAEDVGLNARTITEQLDLEANDPDFARYLLALSQIALIIDQAKIMSDYTKNDCSIDVAKTLVELKPTEFNNMVNVYLPKENLGPEILFSFDKYGNLKSKQKVMESDHIPSYKALEWLFINYGVSFQGKTKNKNRYSNLADNATAVLIPYSTHRGNRTTGIQNEVLAKDDGSSSTKLRNATLKDFATLLWVEKTNANNFNALLKVFPQVYIRNKMLCLYDLDNKSSQGSTLQQIMNNLGNFDYQGLLNQI